LKNPFVAADDARPASPASVKMDLSDLLIFKTVAEEGGILRAARKLHRVQSNVTTRIKQLEASIGARLFFRDRQRLVLSPNGESLLVYAGKLLRLAEEARDAVSGQAPSGVLRLGALESTSASRLPGVLARFHRAFPSVRIELQTGTNDALTIGVKDRRLDAAFVAEASGDKALGSLPLFREKLVLISSLDHRRVAGPRDVCDDSIIAFPNGCAYRRVLERWLGLRRLTTVRVLELSSYHAIVACVASGTGVAVLPESVLDVVNTDEVARYPLPRVLAEAITPLIWRAAEPSPSVVALRELLNVERKALRDSRPRADRLKP
jgi:DNA-binding transcriptional LysR family regulator